MTEATNTNTAVDYHHIRRCVHVYQLYKQAYSQTPYTAEVEQGKVYYEQGYRVRETTTVYTEEQADMEVPSNALSYLVSGGVGSTASKYQAIYLVRVND